jgi:hypothetical protein
MSSSSSSSAAEGDDAGQKELARRLAHTDKSVRDSAFAAVGDWLVRHKVSGGDNGGADARLQMMKMWKALFYCVWMSDKPAVQAELVTAVAMLPRKLLSPPPQPPPTNNTKRAAAAAAAAAASSSASSAPSAASQARAALFFECAFSTLRREWMGLDRYRVDKYLLLLRRLVHELLAVCGRCGWDSAAARALLGDGTVGARARNDGDGAGEGAKWDKRAGVLVREILAHRPNGLRLHVADLYVEELGRAFPEGTLGTDEALAALAPLLAVLRDCDDKGVFDRVRGEVFGAEGASDGGTSSLLACMREDAPGNGGGAEGDGEGEQEGDAEMAAAAGAAGSGDVRPFRKVRASAFARALFSIGADPTTRGGHRDAVYALHKEFAAVARGPREGASDADVVGAVQGMAAVAAAAAAPAAVPAAAAAADPTLKKKKRKEEAAVEEEEEAPVRRKEGGKGKRAKRA